MTFLPALLLASVQFGAPFSDGVVLQRNTQVPIWGMAEPKEQVTVRFAGQTKTARADEKGAWKVELDPMEGSCENRVLTANEACVSNVVVGEVWLCAGQSNMNLRLFGSPQVRRHAEQALDAGYYEGMLANEPMIRAIEVPKCWNPEPQRTYSNKPRWIDGTKGQMLYFSAIGYHFAQILHQALGVPVGVINCSWGGANIAGFIPKSGYLAEPSLKGCATTPITNRANIAWYQNRASWNGEVNPLTPMAVAGMLWYQGESDLSMRSGYLPYLRALWKGWAKEFNHPGLPCYVVQIAPHDYGFKDGAKDPWASNCEIWEAESDFAQETPNAACVATVDIGTARNIHCNHKRVVALRLAAEAMKRLYGRGDIDTTKPVFTGLTASNEVAIVSFSGVKGWELYNEPAIVPFELAEANGPWVLVPTNNITYLNGGKVTLKAPGVTKPAKVRYNWNWFYHGQLLNELGNPVPPFRSVREEHN